jgi:hypothetical protein
MKKECKCYMVWRHCHLFDWHLVKVISETSIYYADFTNQSIDDLMMRKAKDFIKERLTIEGGNSLLTKEEFKITKGVLVDSNRTIYKNSYKNVKRRMVNTGHRVAKYFLKRETKNERLNLAK